MLQDILYVSTFPWHQLDDFPLCMTVETWNFLSTVHAYACSLILLVNRIVAGVWPGEDFKQERQACSWITACNKALATNAKEKPTNVSSTTTLKSQRFCPEAKFSSRRTHQVFVPLETNMQRLEKNKQLRALGSIASWLLTKTSALPWSNNCMRMSTGAVVPWWKTHSSVAYINSPLIGA